MTRAIKAAIGKTLRSTWAYLLFVVSQVFGFIWASSHEDAPYETFAWVILAGLATYLGKRIAQKTKLVKNGTTSEGEYSTLGRDDCEEGD